MNLKLTLLSTFTFLAGAAVALGLFRQAILNQPVEAFHEHADFALFLNGQRFDFAKDTYMSVQPCVARHDLAIPVAYAHGGEDVSDFVHLHDLDGDVVHIHREGITWHDFFESLKMDFSDDVFIDDAGNEYRNNETQALRFFVNGEEVETLADRAIRDLDEVLISYGAKNRTAESIASELAAVTNKACQSSGACAHRGPQPLESCAASETKPSPILRWLGILR